MTLQLTLKENIAKFNYADIPIDNGRVHRDENSCSKQAEPTNLFNQTATDVACQLLKQQSAPEEYIEVFDGNLLNFIYFVLLFKEVVETKVDNPRGHLTHLIK